MHCIKKYTACLFAVFLFLTCFTGCIPQRDPEALMPSVREETLDKDDEKAPGGEQTPNFNPWDVSAEALSYAQTCVSEEGQYTAPAFVAAYLHLFSRLPNNFLTKREAKALGWDSSQGNLQEVAKGKSIGGDVFGNYEEVLPKGKRYRECDVNYSGGPRGGERLVYSDDGDIYYTNDHYNTFKKLY